MTERADGDSVEAATPTPPTEPTGEGSVTVVGTAHVSQDSVDEVEETIERERPDVVAVELDENRYKRMQGETPEDIDAGDLIKGKTVYQFIAYWLLSYIQTRLGEKFDTEPGADMKAAVDTAERLGLGVALVDRDIQLTIQRFWKRMRLREKLKMAGSMAVILGPPLSVGLGIGMVAGLMVAVIGQAFGGPFFVPATLGASISLPILGSLSGILVPVLDTLALAGIATVVVGLPMALLLTRLAGDAEGEEELDMDNLTDADVVTAMIEEFRHFSPGGAQALIDERDAFIAHRLVALREAGYDVVAVVGAGHREGIENYLAHPETLPPAESLVGLPDSGRIGRILYKAFGYVFTLGFLVFFILLAMAGVRQSYLLVLFGAWFLINGIIAAGLAKLAGAHWPSAIVGGAVAWLTSVNPLLAPGWFAGYVELRYLDVSVGDIGKLNDLLSDEESPIMDILKRMRDVPLFRLILVVGMTNIGSFIASLLFAAVLLPQLSAEVGGVSGLADQMLIGARRSAELIWEVLT
ncbi:MAG: TraB/GumN family protein [Haloarculaceae archaeon]